ncbi:hypothetical protein B0H17DRAFT_1134355 [Mycena rosella]|uniref:Uncharacterized protein n=1 Tax=Mycena rosella TaxID=1033263 RepID=A0AAD7DIS3_MYCRO|nr:hypothetical protein B0H17DRAFT_1134355 [Mycena rosella]
MRLFCKTLPTTPADQSVPEHAKGVLGPQDSIRRLCAGRGSKPQLTHQQQNDATTTSNGRRKTRGRAQGRTPPPICVRSHAIRPRLVADRALAALSSRARGLHKPQSAGACGIALRRRPALDVCRSGLHLGIKFRPEHAAGLRDGTAAPATRGAQYRVTRRVLAATVPHPSVYLPPPPPPDTDAPSHAAEAGAAPQGEDARRAGARVVRSSDSLSKLRIELGESVVRTHPRTHLPSDYVVSVPPNYCATLPTLLEVWESRWFKPTREHCVHSVAFFDLAVAFSDPATCHLSTQLIADSLHFAPREYEVGQKVFSNLEGLRPGVHGTFQPEYQRRQLLAPRHAAHVPPPVGASPQHKLNLVQLLTERMHVGHAHAWSFVRGSSRADAPKSTARLRAAELISLHSIFLPAIQGTKTAKKSSWSTQFTSLTRIWGSVLVLRDGGSNRPKKSFDTPVHFYSSFAGICNLRWVQVVIHSLWESYMTLGFLNSQWQFSIIRRGSEASAIVERLIRLYIRAIPLQVSKWFEPPEDLTYWVLSFNFQVSSRTVLKRSVYLAISCARSRLPTREITPMESTPSDAAQFVRVWSVAYLLKNAGEIGSLRNSLTPGESEIRRAQFGRVGGSDSLGEYDEEKAEGGTNPAGSEPLTGMRNQGIQQSPTERIRKAASNTLMSSDGLEPLPAPSHDT